MSKKTSKKAYETISERIPKMLIYVTDIRNKKKHEN